MIVLRKAILGTTVLVVTYIFWFAYIKVLQNNSFFFYPWIDIPFHLVGGIILGLFFSTLIAFKKPYDSIGEHWISIVLASLLIGILWEYYEYFFNINPNNIDIIFDTIKDLINDTIGALIGTLIAIFIYHLTRLKNYERKNK